MHQGRNGVSVFIDLGSSGNLLMISEILAVRQAESSRSESSRSESSRSEPSRSESSRSESSRVARV